MTTEQETSAARWLARRTLCECGAEPALVAKASNVTLESLLKRAAKEGWALPGMAQSRPAGARLAELAGRLVGEVETIERGVREGAADKARIEAVMSLLKVVEKLGEMTPAGEARSEQQKRSDAELAATLSAVDIAIIAHAEYLAERWADANAGH